MCTSSYHAIHGGRIKTWKGTLPPLKSPPVAPDGLPPRGGDGRQVTVSPPRRGDCKVPSPHTHTRKGPSLVNQHRRQSTTTLTARNQTHLNHPTKHHDVRQKHASNVTNMTEQRLQRTHRFSPAGAWWSHRHHSRHTGMQKCTHAHGGAFAQRRAPLFEVIIPGMPRIIPPPRAKQTKRHQEQKTRSTYVPALGCPHGCVFPRGRRRQAKAPAIRLTHTRTQATKWAHGEKSARAHRRASAEIQRPAVNNKNQKVGGRELGPCLPGTNQDNAPTSHHNTPGQT